MKNKKKNKMKNKKKIEEGLRRRIRKKIKDEKGRRREEGQLRTPNPNNRNPTRLHSS